MNCIKKSAQNRGSQCYAHSANWARKVMKTGNVGSVDVLRAAHLFTFGPRGQGIALRGS